MPTKYWAKIDDGVEGPYEPQVLKFIDGFSPDILVSPDVPESEETWLPVRDVQELQVLLNLNPKDGPAPVLIEAEITFDGLEIQAAGTLEEVWQETTQEMPAVVPAPEPEPVAPSPPPESPIQKFSPQPESPPKEEFVSTSDMLELMDKIAQELDQQKKTAPPAPAPIVAPAPKPVKAKPEPLPSPADSHPVRKTGGRFKVPLLLTGLLLAAASFGLWGMRSGKFSAWKDAALSLFHKESKPAEIPPAETPPPPPPPEPIEQAPPPPEEKPVSRPKTARKPKTAQPPQPEPAAEVIKEEASAPKVEEKELRNQKFYLPGVPSPKLSAPKANTRSPARKPAPKAAESLEESARPAEKREFEAPPPESKKQGGSAPSDWKNESGWGD